MLFVGLGSSADRQAPASFSSTANHGPFSSARNRTRARPTASAGPKQASRRGNRPATTHPTSLWETLRAGAARSGGGGVGVAAGDGPVTGAPAAATGRTNRELTRSEERRVGK